MPNWMMHMPEDMTSGYLPEDAGTLKLIKFECARNRPDRIEELMLLLSRFMRNDAMSLNYSGGTCTISCWLSESELELISHATGCVNEDDENEKVLMEASNVLKEAVEE